MIHVGWISEMISPPFMKVIEFNLNQRSIIINIVLKRSLFLEIFIHPLSCEN